jgi:hypothetical protein
MDLSVAEMIHHNWVGVRGLDQCTNMPGVAGRARQELRHDEAHRPGRALRSRDQNAAAAGGDALGMRDRNRSRMDCSGCARRADSVRWTGADAVDGSDDGGSDGPDVDPTACTATRACDPVVEICVEVEPTSTADNCGAHWQCFTHAGA